MIELKPMGVGDILDAAFRLCKRRFVTFVAIAAVVGIPSSFATALLLGAARRFIPTLSPAEDVLFTALSRSLSPGHLPYATLATGRLAQDLSLDGAGASALILLFYSALIGLAFVLVMSVVYPLCTAALVVNISASYLGESVSATQSYARAFRKLWRLLIAQAWATMLMLLGAALCVVPGIVLWLQLLLVPQVVVLEDHTPWAAIGRARALMTDHLGRAFALAAIVLLLDLVLGTALSVAVGLVPWPLPFVADFLSCLLTQLLIMPLSIATAVLLYYDLRVRKESFQLQHLATLMDEYNAK